MQAFMRSSFTVLGTYLFFNSIVRTQSDALPLQSLIIAPIVCLCFTLICLKRILLMELRKHQLLSGHTLNLGQLWFEFLTFPLLYLYLGQPDMELVLDIKADHTPFDLIPDIFASLVYALYLVLLTRSTNQ
jgi:hypothetical protein